MNNSNKQILTAVLNRVRSKEMSVEDAKEVLEIAGLVELKKVYKKKSVSTEFMDSVDPKTTFIIQGE